jgi:hypothetical protein
MSLHSQSNFGLTQDIDMADERDEQEEGASRIKVVDRRMLNDDERAGKAVSSSTGDAAATTQASTTQEKNAAPKLEIIGGGKSAAASETDTTPTEDSVDDDALDADGEAPEEMSVEELQQMRSELESEQFAALEERIGRPLTEEEKSAVRSEMESRARSAAALEVAPMLHQLLQELHAHAMVHMGLMPNPYTQLIAKNDSEARLAIDSFGAVFEVLKQKLEPALQKEYARVLNDLRVNFVSQTGMAAGTFPNYSAGSDGPKIIH